MTTSFHLQGLTCHSCVKLCTMKLKKLAGVEDVAIELESGASTITADRALTVDDLNAALAGTHYTATV